MKKIITIILILLSALTINVSANEQNDNSPIITLLSAFSDDGAAKLITRGYNSVINIPEAEATLDGVNVEVITSISYLGHSGWTQLDMPEDNILKLGNVVGDDNYKTAMYKVTYTALDSVEEYTIFNGLQMAINNEQKVVFLNEEIKLPTCTSSYYYRVNAMQNKWLNVNTKRTIKFIDSTGIESIIDHSLDTFTPTETGKYILEFESDNQIKENEDVIIDGSYTITTEFEVHEKRTNPINEDSGVFETTYTITNTSETGVGMVGSSCDDLIQIEKIDNLYYVHFTQLSGQYMVDLEIKNNDINIGNILYKEQYEGSSLVREFIFTLDEDAVSQPLDVSMYIIPMGRDVNFSLLLDLENSYTINQEYNIEERPAQFIPSISYLGQDNITRNVNEEFTLPNATAKLGNEDCLVEKFVYYNDETIAITNNKIKLEFIGEYKLVYKASSSSYKTSLGNDTFSIYTTIINVIDEGASDDDTLPTQLYDKFTGTTLTFKNNNHDLNNIEVKVINDELINNDVKKIGDVYNVLSINVVDNLGNVIIVDEEVTVSITLKSTFDFNKTSVYYYNDGIMTKMDGTLNNETYTFNTNTLGTFIIVEESSNNTLLYIILGTSSLVVLSLICVVVVRRKK